MFYKIYVDHIFYEETSSKICERVRLGVTSYTFCTTKLPSAKQKIDTVNFPYLQSLTTFTHNNRVVEPATVGFDGLLDEILLPRCRAGLRSIPSYVSLDQLKNVSTDAGKAGSVVVVVYGSCSVTVIM